MYYFREYSAIERHIKNLKFTDYMNSRHENEKLKRLQNPHQDYIFKVKKGLVLLNFADLFFYFLTYAVDRESIVIVKELFKLSFQQKYLFSGPNIS